MNTLPMDCTRFDALLQSLLDDDIETSDRAFMTTHRESCARCASIEHDLRAIRTEASHLPPLVPENDLWPAIEARIEAPVLPLDARTAGDRHTTPAHRPTPSRQYRRLILAAASLVAVSVSATYLTMRALWRADIDQRVSAQPANQPADPPTTTLGDDPQITPVALLSRTYGEQIGALELALDSRKVKLDSSTVSVIERNMRIIDAAISESMAALAQDPFSQLLVDRYRTALDAKVGLLRTAVMLPATTD
jgi:hypothetical protein